MFYCSRLLKFEESPQRPWNYSVVRPRKMHFLDGALLIPVFESKLTKNAGIKKLEGGSKIGVQRAEIS